MSFWDTSALVKLYIPESDSTDFAGIAGAIGPLVVAAITPYEARTVFRRRELEGMIPAGGAIACHHRLMSDVKAGRIRVIPDSADLEREFGAVVDRCFSATPPIYVRTYDALHLAAARVAGENEFVSADIRQRAAAARLGFTVIPATYPPFP
jgi:predicted nucleic acid-binding protein